jgi:hypothetical protein
LPPHGRSAGLHSFNMNANWFQKEGLNYGRKLNTPSSQFLLKYYSFKILFLTFSKRDVIGI